MRRGRGAMGVVGRCFMCVGVVPFLSSHLFSCFSNNDADERVDCRMVKTSTLPVRLDSYSPLPPLYQHADPSLPLLTSPNSPPFPFLGQSSSFLTPSPPSAMSLYHWMGSPGPSAHCWYCVLMQSVEDPSKAITSVLLLPSL